MPDLSIKSVHSYWHEHYDPMFYKIISFMENVESWTLDGDPELEKALTKLASTLDAIGYVDLQEEGKIIQIANYLKMGRMLRLLQCMDTAHPGAASKILTFAKKNSEDTHGIFKIFLRRNVVFERLRLFGRVFATDRIDAVLKVVGGKEHD